MTKIAKNDGGLTFLRAIDEANRCLLCHDAPCSVACPAGTDPGTFIRKIRFLNLKGAAATIFENNPLGASCAELCPTEQTCRGACLRQGLDHPIDIHRLQAFAVEYARQLDFMPLERGEATGAKVAVVGSGPAGMAAAAKLAELGEEVVIFEAAPEAGGMLRRTVPKSRLDRRIIDDELNDLKALGVKIECNHKVENAQALLDQGYDAVFLAPGLCDGSKLRVPGSDLEGVETAIDFLARAASDEAALDAQVRGKNIAIVGGGSVAMDVARVARERGAKRIYVLSLEAIDELPAARTELDFAHQQGVIFEPQTRTVEITGENGAVSGLSGIEVEWIVPGNMAPTNVRDLEGTNFHINVSRVVFAVGQKVSDSTKALLGAVDWSGRAVMVNQEQETSIPRIFAGGDISRGAGTVVEAVADGKRAAEAIHNLLKEVAR